MMTAEGLTKEGYEIQFGTNHMGHTLFTQLLLPTLQETAKINPETRVISVASASESRAPIDIYKCDELKTMMADRHTTARYCISKIAQVHYNIAIAERYNDIKFICIHPGMVATNLHSESSGRFLKIFLNVAIASFATTVEKGALNQIWASVSPDARTGEFYGPVGAPGVGSRPCRNHGPRGNVDVSRMVLCKLSYRFKAQAGATPRHNDDLTTEIRDIAIWMKVNATVAEHDYSWGNATKADVWLLLWRFRFGLGG